MVLIQGQDETTFVSEGTDVEVTYFTDPYCSWCWAVEPAWMHLKEAYGGAVMFKVVMGGLVENASLLMQGDGERIDWLRAHMHDVSARTGQPIDPAFLDDIDGKFSTWPACIHVKAAQAQSEDLGQRYLRRLRLAVMTERRHASDPRIAGQLVDDIEGLAHTPWSGALADGTALQAFLDDRRSCAEKGVTGFPTFMVRTSGEDAPRVMTGYRPYPELERALLDVAPALEARAPRPIVDLLFDHGPMTTKEIQEIQRTTPRETLDALDDLAAEGTIQKIRRAGGTLWALPE